MDTLIASIHAIGCDPNILPIVNGQMSAEDGHKTIYSGSLRQLSLTVGDIIITNFSYIKLDIEKIEFNGNS